MKQAQLIGIGIAAVCGLGAFVILNKFVSKPKAPIVIADQTNVEQVLVARTEIGLGSIATELNFRWQSWPKESVPPGAITNSGGGQKMRDLANRIARAPIMANEPITEGKLVKPGEGGVLASILPQGMRAISAKISEDTAVGKMILPNDHVDVILIRRMRGRGGQEEHVSDTLFRNVRILAIGQKLDVKDGQKNADGKTATLELTPRQSELLALAKSMGEISLSLRSIADFSQEQGPEGTDLKGKGDRGNAIRVLRYGLKSRAYGVN